jgi:hypothetical protein
MTKEEAAKKTADSIIKIVCGKSQPTRFPRVREGLNERYEDSASYRSAMIDAGRGRLLK